MGIIAAHAKQVEEQLVQAARQTLERYKSNKCPADEVAVVLKKLGDLILRGKLPERERLLSLLLCQGLAHSYFNDWGAADISLRIVEAGFFG